jgi:hypothetical protein
VSSVTAGRDVNIGSNPQPRDEEPQPLALFIAAGKVGQLKVINPGKGETFSIRLENLAVGQTAPFEITNRYLRKDEDTGWLQIMYVERYYSRHGLYYSPAFKGAWENRVRRGVREVTFFHTGGAFNLSVPVNKEFGFTIAVYSDTRCAVKQGVTYGIASETDTIVSPFSEEALDSSNQAETERLQGLAAQYPGIFTADAEDD